jgi:hypothetical protein
MATPTQQANGTIVFDVYQLRLVLDLSDPNRPLACLQTFPADAAPEATGWTDQPVRFHQTDSGDRLAADFPSCGGGSCTIGNWPAETGDHITEG